jgi:hypothetical protein
MLTGPKEEKEEEEKIKQRTKLVTISPSMK